MSNIILHHYPESPFSEKVRLMLGYKKAAYRTVTIPIIMPKPDLMPLTGGYRKTPVMQIGADIYCDTAIICKVIDRMYPENTLYPDNQIASLAAFANWTDTFFFRVCVAEAFQPKALAASPLFADQDAAAAFMADRASLSAGSTQLQMDFALAHPYLLAHLKRLDNQLSHSDYLYRDSPTIADFCTYHCCWFIHGNEAIRDVFDPFGKVINWLQRMAAYGHGNPEAMDGAAALAIASESAPLGVTKSKADSMDALTAGDPVEVMPIDYGFQPVRGELQLISLEEIVVKRTDGRVGEVAVHFPRLGFQIARVEGKV